MTTSEDSYNWPMKVANRIMANYPNTFANRLPVLVWAAKPNDCPRCPAKAGERCLHLTKLKQGIAQPTIWPHTARVDWAKLVKTLKERGYRIYL
jgi:hypothetical protein